MTKSSATQVTVAYNVIVNIGTIVFYMYPLASIYVHVPQTIWMTEVDAREFQIASSTTPVAPQVFRMFISYTRMILLTAHWRFTMETCCKSPWLLPSQTRSLLCTMAYIDRQRVSMVY